MLSLLLRVADRPNSRQMARRVRNATRAFLQIYALPLK
jgi:hypothetical protein